MASPDTADPNPASTRAGGDPALESIFQGVTLEELFARGMQSVRMTAAGPTKTWDAPTVQEMARLFPHYEILELIGRGGMGAVYKARQKALDRFVAVKILPLEVSVDRDFAERFVREAKTMARLNHPNIVSVYDFGTTIEGHLFFVMEFVEGTTLHQMIKTVGLNPAQSLEIIVAVCEALQFAHEEGVVHRDVKPANVLVDTKGRVKVMDFGLARIDQPDAQEWGHTITGAVLGTPDYMAPEQKSGLRVDHRADIYSLGVMLYEMLCGQVPQGVFDPPSVRVRVDERVDQVVIRAMQQEPDRRYSNTCEMRTEVQTIRTSPGARPGPQARRLAQPITVAAPEDLGQVSWTDRITQLGVLPLSGITGGAVLISAIVIWASLAQQPPATFAAAVKATPAPAHVEAPPAADPLKPPIPAAPALPEPNPGSKPPAVAVTEPDPQRAQKVPQQNPPPVDQVKPAPVTELSPAPVGTEGTMPPAAVPVNAVLKQWEETVAQAEARMSIHDLPGAAERYEKAIALGEAEPAIIPVMEVALLCKKLGQLQTAIAAPIEARDTFMRGKRLLKTRGASVRDPARGKLLGEFDVLIERLRRQTE